MAVLKCEACGTPLPSKSGAFISVCEYCGAENIVSSNDNNFELKNVMTIEDIVVITVPCIVGIYLKNKYL